MSSELGSTTQTETHKNDGGDGTWIRFTSAGEKVAELYKIHVGKVSGALFMRGEKIKYF